MLIPLLDRWARSSQQQARRNAMIASTRLTQRRIEREEVDRFLAGRRSGIDPAAMSRMARTGPTSTPSAQRAGAVAGR